MSTNEDDDNNEQEILNSIENFVKANLDDDELVVEHIKKVLNFSDNIKAKHLVDLIKNVDFNFETQTLSTLKNAIHLPIKSMKGYLLIECLSCLMCHPKDNIYSFLCGCFLCYKCFNQWFILKISNTYDMNQFYCPENVHLWKTEEEHEGYLKMLNLFILHNKTLDKKFKLTFFEKLASFSAAKLGHFVFCRQGCETLLVVKNETNPIQCPNCPNKICIYCHWQWTDAHCGKSCEQFQIETDAVVKQLWSMDNGIFCPQCKRLTVQLGGCRHYNCPFCSFSFCSGCRAKFYTKENKCLRQSHRNHDLHAHHQRNCAYFLCDGNSRQEVRQNVLNLLTHANVPIDCEKESNDEYLLRLIVTHQVDPIDHMNIEQLEFHLKNNPIKHIAVPKKPIGCNEENYTQLLRNKIKREFPLKNWFLS